MHVLRHFPVFVSVSALSTWRPARNRALGACLQAAVELGSLRAVPLPGPGVEWSLRGPSRVSLWLHAQQWRCLCGPCFSHVRFSVPSALRQGSGTVHRSCFVWGPVPPFGGWSPPRPGAALVCVCVCVCVFAGLLGAFWCASPFLWPLWLLSVLLHCASPRSQGC